MELCWEVLVGENESKFRPSWSIASLHGVWGPQFFCLGACLSCGLETALQSSVCSLEHQVPCWSRQRPGGWSPGGVGVPHSAGSLERGSQALLASSGTSGLGVCCQLALQQESEGHQAPVSKQEPPSSPSPQTTSPDGGGFSCAGCRLLCQATPHVAARGRSSSRRPRLRDPVGRPPA